MKQNKKFISQFATNLKDLKLRYLSHFLLVSQFILLRFSFLSLLLVTSISSPIISQAQEKKQAEGYEEQVKESSQQVKLLAPTQKPSATSPTTEDPKAQLPPNGFIPKDFAFLDKSHFHSAFLFLVDKSTRTLTIWKSNKNQVSLVKALPVDMGRKSGNKQKENDMKTPEGLYFFQDTYNQQQIDFNEYGERAYTLDYPNYYDRRDKKTGKGIWLHAIPDSKSLLRGSRGCLVIRNREIEALQDYITFKKTPIIIESKVQYISPVDHQEEENHFLNFLKNWKKSWQDKNISDYMNFYDNDFRSMKMKKNQWRKYKESLNEKYKYISITLSDPVVYSHSSNRAIVKFIQEYSSNGHADIGEKTLYLKKSSDGDYKIYGEEWAPLNRDLLAQSSDGIKI